MKIIVSHITHNPSNFFLYLKIIYLAFINHKYIYWKYRNNIEFNFFAFAFPIQSFIQLASSSVKDFFLRDPQSLT